MMADKLSAAARGASFMMLAALAQKVATTVLNTLLIRFVTADVMGFAGNDMELLLATILFLSRESFRHVADRFPAGTLSGTDAKQRSYLVSLAVSPVPIGLCLSVVAGVVYQVWDAGAADLQERRSFLLFCLAAAVETLAEPLYIMCSSSLLYSVRARAEISGVVVKCVTTFALAYAGYGALAFGVGQLAFAVSLLTQYYRGLADALPGPASPLQMLSTAVRWREAGAALLQVRSPAAAVRAFVGPESASLLLGFAGQGIVKHMLTEGDRLLLAALASRSDRGAYAVVANYGSLAARLLFQPVEESVRRLTAQSRLGLSLRAASSSRSETHELQEQQQQQQQPRPAGQKVVEGDTAATSPSGAPGGLSPEQQGAVAAFTASSYLVSWVGLAACSVGPAMAPLFVRYVMGRHWLQDSAVAPTLAVYCLYVLCMSLNGVTEAFATAIATTTRLHSANIVLACAFVCYAGLAVLLLPTLGTPGLVLAGCVNMAVRIASSVRYIRASLAGAPGGPHSLAGCVPSVRVWGTALVVLIASMLSSIWLHVWRQGHGSISVVAAALMSSGSVGALQRLLTSYGLAAGHLLHTAVCATGALALLVSTWLFDRSRAAAGLMVLGRRRAVAAASATASAGAAATGSADPSKED